MLTVPATKAAVIQVRARAVSTQLAMSQQPVGVATEVHEEEEEEGPLAISQAQWFLRVSRRQKKKTTNKEVGEKERSFILPILCWPDRLQVVEAEEVEEKMERRQEKKIQNVSTFIDI